MITTQSITLDLHSRSYYNTLVCAKQGDDKSRVLLVTVTENGAPYTPPSGAEAEFRCLKQDGCCVWDQAAIRGDGTVEVVLTEQVLATPGIVSADLCFRDGSGRVLSTASFAIRVEAAPFGAHVESCNEYLTLKKIADRNLELTGEYETALDALEKLSEGASTAAGAANQAAQAALEEAEQVRKIAQELMENGFGLRLDALEQQVEDLHYVPVDITSCSVTPSVAELGSQVVTATLSWSVNKMPAYQVADGAEVEKTQRSLQLDGLSITEDKSFTVSVRDEREKTDSAVAWLRFYNGVYYGALEVDRVINSAAVLGMSKSLQSGKAKTFTATAGEGQKFAYALPSRYGTPAFNVGGFDYIWTKAASFDFTNASGYTEQYDVWLNDEVVVGTRTIKVT